MQLNFDPRSRAPSGLVLGIGAFANQTFQSERSSSVQKITRLTSGNTAIRPDRWSSQWYWKGDFVKSLPDDAIDTHIAQAAQAPSELSLMHLYPIEGAVHRVPKDATASNTRDATWSMVITGIDPDPKQADALKTWGCAYWTAIHPFNLEGAYVNFMSDDEVQGRV
jgi:hypothetical protein